jgi:hypothetical protein
MKIVKVAAGVFFGLFIIGFVSNIVSPPTNPTGAFVMPQTVFTPAPLVTMSEYSQLQTGISYEDAVGIIGATGQEMSSNDLAGIRTILYSWSNASGANMNAMFQDGKLVTKAQFGLE